MSGSAPARAHSNPDAGNSNTGVADASPPALVQRYNVPGPDVAANSASVSSAKPFALSDLKAPTYVLVALLATFVVIAPYFMHANWGALGPDLGAYCLRRRSRLPHCGRPRRDAQRRRHHHVAVLGRRKHADFLDALRHRLPHELEAHANLALRPALCRCTRRPLRRQHRPNRHHRSARQRNPLRPSEHHRPGPPNHPSLESKSGSAPPPEPLFILERGAPAPLLTRKTRPPNLTAFAPATDQIRSPQRVAVDSRWPLNEIAV